MREPDERLADRRALLHDSLGVASLLDPAGESFTRGNLHNSPEAVRNGSGEKSDSYTSAGLHQQRISFDGVCTLCRESLGIQGENQRSRRVSQVTYESVSRHYLACKVSLTPLNYKRVSPKFSTFRRFGCHFNHKRAYRQLHWHRWVPSRPLGIAGLVRGRAIQYHNGARLQSPTPPYNSPPRIFLTSC